MISPTEFITLASFVQITGFKHSVQNVQNVLRKLINEAVNGWKRKTQIVEAIEWKYRLISGKAFKVLIFIVHVSIMDYLALASAPCTLEVDKLVCVTLR